MTRSEITRFKHLSQNLRSLVSQSVAILGDVICREAGKSSYSKIEKILREMVQIRGSPAAALLKALHRTLRNLEKCPRDEQLKIARAFTLMLELMNTCENAYRSIRIGERRLNLSKGRPDSIIYVLTAHPTEARSPQNIRIFQEIQRILIKILSKHQIELEPEDREQLRHWLEVAWRAPAIRNRKPSVHDEADHIYSTLLRDETLKAFLKAGRDLAPVYARSWVGGDKDGHPGVNEQTLMDSFQTSRDWITQFIQKQLSEVRKTSLLIKSPKLREYCQKVACHLKAARSLQLGDARKALRLRLALRQLIKQYELEIGALHPSLHLLSQLLKTFPAFVVPLEFREASNVLHANASVDGLAIVPRGHLK